MLRTSACHTLSLLLAIGACGPGGGGSDAQDGSSTSGSTSGGSSSGTTAEPTTSTGSTTSGSTGGSTGETTAGTGETTTSDVTTTSADTTTSETGDTTGGGLPDGACRTNADCDPRMAESCFAPDESNCGACQAPDKPCVEGDGCAGNEACVPFDATCACNPGETHCVPQCSKDSCGEAAVCNGETGICEPLTCSEDGVECPPLFDCVPGSGGDECVRRSCASDDDCDGAPCVEGGC